MHRDSGWAGSAQRLTPQFTAQTATKAPAPCYHVKVLGLTEHQQQQLSLTPAAHQLFSRFSFGRVKRSGHLPSAGSSGAALLGLLTASCWLCPVFVIGCPGDGKFPVTCAREGGWPRGVEPGASSRAPSALVARILPAFPPSEVFAYFPFNYSFFWSETCLDSLPAIVWGLLKQLTFPYAARKDSQGRSFFLVLLGGTGQEVCKRWSKACPDRAQGRCC